MQSKYNTNIEGIDLQALPFAGEVLKPLSSQEIAVGKPIITSVDLTKVVGTLHPDYQGKSWGDLKPIIGTNKGDIVNDSNVAYQPLKRAVLNVRELNRNPDYYFNMENKDHWSFYEIDGQYYISSGNNRTVVARLFLFLNGRQQIVHGVKVTPARWLNNDVLPSDQEGKKGWFRTLLGL